jgi:hypothetical protein
LQALCLFLTLLRTQTESENVDDTEHPDRAIYEARGRCLKQQSIHLKQARTKVSASYIYWPLPHVDCQYSVLRDRLGCTLSQMDALKHKLRQKAKFLEGQILENKRLNLLLRDERRLHLSAIKCQQMMSVTNLKLQTMRVKKRLRTGFNF